jgi:hypothetical protein
MSSHPLTIPPLTYPLAGGQGYIPFNILCAREGEQILGVGVGSARSPKEWPEAAGAIKQTTNKQQIKLASNHTT